MEKRPQPDGGKLVPTIAKEEQRPGEKMPYVTPTVRVMDEAEALSAFQATAAGSAMWWVSF